MIIGNVWDKRDINVYDKIVMDEYPELKEFIERTHGNNAMAVQQLGVISYLIEKFSSNSTLEQVSCNLKDEMMEIYKQYKKEVLGE